MRRIWLIVVAVLLQLSCGSVSENNKKPDSGTTDTGGGGTGPCVLGTSTIGNCTL